MSQINETAIRTPGVYTTEIPTLAPSVAQVSTAVPAFIGYTQRAHDENNNPLTNIPTKIFSLKEYEQYFGFAENETGIIVDVDITTDANLNNAIVSRTANARFDNVTPTPPSLNNMYYSIRHYFNNGGGPCYIVSVGVTNGTILQDDLAGVNANAGGGLAALAACDEPTLIVFPEGQGLSEVQYYGLIELAFDQCRDLQDRFVLVDVHHDMPLGRPVNQPPNTTTTINTFRTAFGRSTDLNYGAAYYPNLRTTYNYSYQTKAVHVIVTHRVIPLRTIPPTPPNPVPAPVVDAAVTLDTLIATETAVYNLCLARIREQLNPTLPPTPAIAGVYAQVDGSRGVWKAPANVSLNAVQDLTDFITEAEQGDMNVDPGPGKSVNAIRLFTGRGRLVWGARTLDGNSNEWRFISVRRLFITVEESAKKATFQFVFEPNDANTWVKIRAMLENYLTLLWRQGALAGAKPEHAFFVKCGLGQTMTAQDILDGKLIVEIGMAAVRPAEFIILRFTHKLQES
jgi:phage tail sheath protein FI